MPKCAEGCTCKRHRRKRPTTVTVTVNITGSFISEPVLVEAVRRAIRHRRGGLNG